MTIQTLDGDRHNSVVEQTGLSQPKRAYTAPRLKTFGEVRVITGSNMGATVFDNKFDDISGVIMEGMMMMM